MDDVVGQCRRLVGALRACKAREQDDNDDISLADYQYTVSLVGRRRPYCELSSSAVQQAVTENDFEALTAELSAVLLCGDGGVGAPIPSGGKG